MSAPHVPNIGISDSADELEHLVWVLQLFLQVLHLLPQPVDRLPEDRRLVHLAPPWNSV
jgi:hypothetical protein